MPQVDTASVVASKTTVYQPLLGVLAAVCGGIWLDRQFAPPLFGWVLVAVMAWLGWLWAWRHDRLRAASILLWVAAAGWSGAWHHAGWFLFGVDDVAQVARIEPQPICAEAVVTRSPRRVSASPPSAMQPIPYADRTLLEVEFCSLRDGQRWRTASGRVRMTVEGHLLGVHVGDRVRVFGHLAAPTPLNNPGGIDYASYARAAGISALLTVNYPDCVRVVARARFSGLAGLLDQVRNQGHELLQKHLEPRRAPLADALLLGIREELAGERTELFLETGTIHLLSVSGLHVGIVAAALLLFLRALQTPRRLRAVLVALAVVGYTCLTGAEPPAVRSAILVLMFCGGQLLARRPLPFNSLALAALVVLWLNPEDLFNIGAQLSFLSVAGLLGYAIHTAQPRPDALDRLLEQSRPWPVRLLRRLAADAWHVTVLGCVIWLLTLPLVAARFHVIALATIVLNALIWLPVAVALVSGFALLALGWLAGPLAAVLGWCCDCSLALLEGLIVLGRQVPNSCLWVPGPADWWLVGFYGGLGLWALFPRWRPPRRWCLALLAGWTALGLTVAMRERPHEALQCTVLDVGHGCAVLVELPNGRTLLYDAGKLAAPESGMRAIAGCLWAQGRTHLDALVISHADADHYDAIPGLLQRFSVGVVYVGPGMFQQESLSLRALRQALERSGTPIRELSAGEALDGGIGCRVEVLHPPQDQVAESDNAQSIVLGLEYAGQRILLPGDLEPPGLEALLAQPPWDCNVLLAPHHGSRSSNSPALAAWCHPEWVLVSGSRSRTGASSPPRDLPSGCQVLQTSVVGAVQVRFDRRGVEVRGFRQPAHR